jgi:hypothetical protein
MGIEATGSAGSRHFQADQEEELRRDASTTSVVSRARAEAKVGGDAAIRGDDLSWKELKEHQHSEAGVMLALHVGHAALEGAHFTEAHAIEAFFAGHGVRAAGVMGTLAVGGMALGIHEIYEAHENGKAQAAAIAKDQAHVALVGSLDLPDGFKAERFGRYPEVDRGDNGAAAKIMMALRSDPKGLATLQLHADRGMNAAKDLAASGGSRAAFLAANPKVAKAYENDAAFREGFDAMTWARDQKDPSVQQKLDAGLRERDGWYAQSNVSFRV